MVLLVFAAQMQQLGLGWKTYILVFEGLETIKYNLSFPGVDRSLPVAT